MEFWFSELHSPHVKFDIRVEKQLFSGESDYQRIDVFQSPEFGKFLTLNGSVIFSEQDCFIYNEMVVHVPMSVHPDVKNVLINEAILFVGFIPEFKGNIFIIKDQINH